MCRSEVSAEAEPLLAAVLADIARALCPDDPQSVVIGPVDFGPDPGPVLPFDAPAMVVTVADL